jgi:hypothetical protein
MKSKSLRSFGILLGVLTSTLICTANTDAEAGPLDTVKKTVIDTVKACANGAKAPTITGGVGDLSNAFTYRLDTDVNGDGQGAMFVTLSPDINIEGEFAANCKVKIKLFERVRSAIPFLVWVGPLPVLVSPNFGLTVTLTIDAPVGGFIDTNIKGTFQEGLVQLNNAWYRCGKKLASDDRAKGEFKFGCLDTVPATLVRFPNEVRTEILQPRSLSNVRPQLEIVTRRLTIDPKSQFKVGVDFAISFETLFYEIAGPRLTLSPTLSYTARACPPEGKPIWDLAFDMPGELKFATSKAVDNVIKKATEKSPSGKAAEQAAKLFFKQNNIDGKVPFPLVGPQVISQAPPGDTWDIVCDTTSSTTSTTAPVSNPIDTVPNPVTPSPQPPPSPRKPTCPPENPAALITLDAVVRKVDGYSPFEKDGRRPKITAIVMFPFETDYPLSSLPYPTPELPKYIVKIDGIPIPKTIDPGKILFEPRSGWAVASDAGDFMNEIYLVSYGTKLPSTVTVTDGPGCPKTLVTYRIPKMP